MRRLQREIPDALSRILYYLIYLLIFLFYQFDQGCDDQGVDEKSSRHISKMGLEI